MDVHDNCRELAEVLSRIGDKWTVLVVGTLGEKPRRFNEIARMVDGISQRMLTLTLRGLERDGMVKRTAYATIPPRVDYELTDLGRTLIEPLIGLYDWASKYRPSILAARQKFDDRKARAEKGVKPARRAETSAVVPPASVRAR
jgi:DNA-binding HxlR family transcriptional regulator